MITSPDQITLSRRDTRSWRAINLPFNLTWASAALIGVVILAAALRLYNIDSVGNANQYYTAAVKSMLQSFHNFFFIAAEPGGSVTIDKPPLGLWLQAISALIFGVSGVSVVLPQIVAGILSVPLLYHLVRRYFGSAAGLIAALVLAVTPVSIAVERNNTMDATLIFTLLLAAWAFIKATDTGKLRFLLVGGLLVGLGFNIKMLQAFLPLPAFYGLYLLGAKLPFKKKFAHLVLATLVLVAVSFSWATVVQLTPADQRPYIGSTQNNNVFELIFGYNGLNRLLGNTPGAGNAGSSGAPANGTLPQPPANAQGTAPTGLPGTPPTGADDGRMQAGGGGGFNIGTAGVFRLVTTPLANEVGWLLPFGLASIALLALGTRIKFPLSDNHKAVVLWGGWLVTATVFFSVAGFFHPYYLAMLAVPLAALVGIGTMRLWQLRETHTLRIGLLIIALFGGTLIFQVYTASQYTATLWWVIPAGVALVAGSVLLVVRRNMTRLATIGFVCVLVAALWVPFGWASLTSTNSNASAALPEAYSGASVSNGPLQAFSGPMSSTVDSKLLAYLEAHTADVDYLVAVPSSMQGSAMVLATGRPVLLMGGFSGSDPVVDATSLAKLVNDLKLRYVLDGGAGMPGSSKTDVTTWLTANCTVVTEFSSGTSTTTTTDGRGPGGQMASTLYMCTASAT